MHSAHVAKLNFQWESDFCRIKSIEDHLRVRSYQDPDWDFKIWSDTIFTVGPVHQENYILDNVALKAKLRVQGYIANTMTVEMHKKFFIYNIEMANVCVLFLR